MCCGVEGDSETAYIRLSREESSHMTGITNKDYIIINVLYKFLISMTVFKSWFFKAGPRPGVTNSLPILIPIHLKDSCKIQTKIAVTLFYVLKKRLIYGKGSFFQRNSPFLLLHDSNE